MTLLIYFICLAYTEAFMDLSREIRLKRTDVSTSSTLTYTPTATTSVASKGVYVMRNGKAPRSRTKRKEYIATPLIISAGVM